MWKRLNLPLLGLIATSLTRKDGCVSNQVRNPGKLVLQLLGGIVVFFVLMSVINYGLSVINDPNTENFVIGTAITIAGLGTMAYLGLRVVNRINQGVTETPTKEK